MIRHHRRAHRRISRCIFVPGLILLLGAYSIFGQSRPSPAAGAISGRVTTEDGQSVDGATVQLIGGATPKTAVSDAEGNFTFNGLTPTAYRIAAYAPGYVSAAEYTGMGLIARVGESISVNLVKGGVLSGRVTDTNGEPVVAVNVSAMRIRDGDGRPVPMMQAVRQRPTDDRGIYRLYGLSPGTYVVAANPTTGDNFRATGFDQETPTFYPSSPREGATEVAVQLGAEVGGIDIRYRSLRGHAVSGTIEGAGSNNIGIQIKIQAAGGNGLTAWGFSQLVGGNRPFFFDGLPDGDYDLFAIGTNQEAGFISTPKRISLRGADLKGIILTATPMATIAGKVVLETATLPEDCQRGRQASLTELWIQPWNEVKTNEFDMLNNFVTRVVQESGEFVLRNLMAGQYRLDADLPSDNWYVKALTMPGAAAARRTIDLGRSPLTLKNGENVTGLTMTISEGAAAINGRIEGEKFKRAARYSVHLIPVDAAQADQQLFYYESFAKADGSFSFTNLAPGKYWAIARPLTDDQASERPGRKAASDAAERAKLRREAEAAKQEIELKTCQRMKEFALKLL